MIQKTMTRQQLFQLGNLDWATSDELMRAKGMKTIYDQLTTAKQQELIEHFDKFLRADDLTFAIVTDALLGT